MTVLADVAAMSPAEAAATYAAERYTPIPVWWVEGGSCACPKGADCQSPGKHPIGTAWQRQDQTSLEAWAKYPRANVGLLMGGERRLVALDVDGDVGRASLAELEAEHGVLPPTLTAKSGRPDGGEHRIFRVPDAWNIESIRSRSNVRPKLDVRSAGGQIVAAPSVHVTGGRYKWSNAIEPAELPRWLYEVLSAPNRKDLAPALNAELVDMGEQAKRARAWLAECEPSIQGSGGTQRLWHAASIVHRFSISPSTAVELLAQVFNPICMPAWSRAELERAVERQRKAAHSPPSKAKDRPRQQRARSTSPHDEEGSTQAADERPVVQWGVDLHRVTDDAVGALAKNDPGVYQRDGALVHVVTVPEPDGFVARGTPTVRTLPNPTLRERMSRSMRWERFDGRSEEWRPCLPPDAAVSAVSSRGEWPGVRPLTGILEAPSLRPDGTIIEAEGYDDSTGYLHRPSARFESIKPCPTPDDARQALATLSEPFADFPWASPAGKSAMIASILTMLARPAIAGSCPAFVVDANTRGSGKSLAADIAAIVATGRGASRMSWPPDDIELEKVLGAYALRAATLVCFDNITRAFGGGPLDRCLTAEDKVELRVLGKSEVPSMRWRTVVLATGNNVVLFSDTSRRVLLARLESPEENPENRTGFKHEDLRTWVRQNRPRLVAAALTILRAYIVADRPNMGTATWGSFEAWSQLIPPALVYAGAVDPLAARPVAMGREDAEKEALEALIEGWERLAPEGGISTRDIVRRLYTREQLNGEAPPDDFDGLREAIEHFAPARPGAAPSARTLGTALGKIRRRVVAGKTLDARVLRGNNLWFVTAGGGHGGLSGTDSNPRPPKWHDSLNSKGGNPLHPAHHTHHSGDGLRPQVDRRLQLVDFPVDGGDAA